MMGIVPEGLYKYEEDGCTFLFDKEMIFNESLKNLSDVKSNQWNGESRDPRSDGAVFKLPIEFIEGFNYETE